MKSNIHSTKFIWIIRIENFICGAVIMALELLSSRILNPYYGNSIFVWGSIIGVVLLSLSLGYFFGGRIADTNPSSYLLSLIILFAGQIILIIPTITSSVVNIVSKLGMNNIYSPLITSFLLLFMPTMLLAMVSPFIIKLSARKMESIGGMAGNLYFLSTLGSIFGTFVTVFFLIPNISITLIFLILGLVLIFISFIGVDNKIRIFSLIIIFTSQISYLGNFEISYPINLGEVIYRRETTYNSISILEDKIKGIRTLWMNGLPHSAMYLDGSNKSVFIYTDYFHLSYAFDNTMTNILFIGGGGFTAPKKFLAEYQDVKIDVVELDPVVVDLAYEYFGVEENARLKIYVDDGRSYLINSEKKYDLIVLDAYSKNYIPFHMMTKEFFEEVLKDLKPEGLVAVNYITSLSGDASKLFLAEYKTLASIFPRVHVYPTNQSLSILQNVIVFTTKSFITPSENQLHSAIDRFGNYFLNDSRTYTESKLSEEELPIITDDYAPVEHFLNPITNLPFGSSSWIEITDSNLIIFTSIWGLMIFILLLLVYKKEKIFIINKINH